MPEAQFSEPPAPLLQRDEPQFVSLVRARCALRVRWMRHCWSENPAEPGQGIAIPHEEVDRILAGPVANRDPDIEFLEHDAAARKIVGEIETLELQLASSQHWNWFLEEFGLSREERDLLFLCLAAEVDPALRRVYGYIHDNAASCYPSQWLASSLFGWPSAIMIVPDSALVRWRMAWPTEDGDLPWRALAPWVADPNMVAWAQQNFASDPALTPSISYFPVASSATLPCLYPEQMSEMMDVVQAVGRSRVPILLELIGPPGTGKLTLTAQVGAALGLPLISVDAASLFGSDVNPVDKLASDRMIRVARLARLTGALLYFHDLDAINPSVWPVLEDIVCVMVFGVRFPTGLAWRKPVVRRTVRLPSLSHAAQSLLWRHFKVDALVEPLDQWLMTPRDVVNVVHSLPAGTEAVLEACRGAALLGSSELFTRLPCPFTWADIILPPPIREHLKELEQQVRLRHQVYDDWGFGRLNPMGRGVTAMFSGPSGVGKTMAAQVLAQSLGMELYRVDLAGVMNKYIGETEKRIKQVFELSERRNVILFFDEADALFGQRTQVKDAHDRFANIEIDYLLQLMEQFDGIAILATNRKGDLDKAFLRRIRFIIDFMEPGPVERLAIWRRVLPEQSPASEIISQGIDWDFLANKLNMTGADITAAGLSAAFLARSENSPICMKHILHTAQREMTKHGLVLRPGDWEN